jgi:transmembrane sensor
MNFSAERIVALIIKRLNGDLNETESIELQDWINQSEENRQAIEDFVDENKLQAGISHLYQARERIWQRLHKEIPDKKTAPVRRLVLRYAAAAAGIAMLISLSYYFISSHALISPAVTKKDTIQTRINNDVNPGGDRAELTLADGSVIVLDSIADGALAQQNDTRIIKSEDGQLAYDPGKNTAAISQRPMAYNTLVTPRGGQYRLLLPDGSKVWLNAASSLRYPVSFAGNERNVELTGEAFFEIAKDKAKPFKVKIQSPTSAGNLGEVEVLGTHFNINAYDDEPVIKTTLLEGSVKISAASGQSSMLKRAQQAVLTHNSQLTINDKVDTEEAVAWKNGLFQLTSADVQVIMRQIARWYNVEVKYESTIPGGHITGKVSRDMKLSQVLEVLKLSGIHTRIESGKVIVLP